MEEEQHPAASSSQHPPSTASVAITLFYTTRHGHARARTHALFSLYCVFGHCLLPAGCSCPLALLLQACRTRVGIIVPSLLSSTCTVPQVHFFGAKVGCSWKNLGNTSLNRHFRACEFFAPCFSSSFEACQWVVRNHSSPTRHEAARSAALPRSIIPLAERIWATQQAIEKKGSCSFSTVLFNHHCEGFLCSF